MQTEEKQKLVIDCGPSIPTIGCGVCVFVSLAPFDYHAIKYSSNLIGINNGDNSIYAWMPENKHVFTRNVYSNII